VLQRNIAAFFLSSRP